MNSKLKAKLIDLEIGFFNNWLDKNYKGFKIFVMFFRISMGIVGILSFYVLWSKDFIFFLKYIISAGIVYFVINYVIEFAVKELYKVYQSQPKK